MITQDELKKQLHYDPETGVFTTTSGKVRKPRKNADLNGKSYTYAKLAWLYVNGEFPPHRLKHANGDRLDNRLSNLVEDIQDPDAKTRNLTQEQLKSLLDYDPLTGIFTRRVARSNCVKVGEVVGCVCRSTGYVVVNINHVVYAAHRLAWLYVYGYFPAHHTDHINGVKADNRISNLREASSHQNGCNSKNRKNNKSGYKGVYWAKTLGKYIAKAQLHRKSFHIGVFDDPKVASDAYNAFVANAHEEFYRDTRK